MTGLTTHTIKRLDGDGTRPCTLLIVDSHVKLGDKTVNFTFPPENIWSSATSQCQTTSIVGRKIWENESIFTLFKASFEPSAKVFHNHESLKREQVKCGSFPSLSPPTLRNEEGDSSLPCINNTQANRNSNCQTTFWVFWNVTKGKNKGLQYYLQYFCEQLIFFSQPFEQCFSSIFFLILI